MSGQFYVQVAIWSQVASAVLFVAVMVYIWLRWLQPMVLVAQERSNEQIAEAEHRRDIARESLQALRDEIEGARSDAELIRARAQTQAEAERRALIDEAREEGERVLRNAQGELARSREAARVRLRDEMLARALYDARAEAKRRIDKARNEKIVDRFLVTLERVPE